MSDVQPFHNWTTIIPRLREVIGHGLTSGVGEPEPGKLCVEAAVCLVLGLPHGDVANGCVGAPDRAFAVRLNDARWSSDQARAEGMTDLAVAHLGSATMTKARRSIWRAYLVGQTIRRVVPFALRRKGASPAMLAAADRCEREGTREAALAGHYAGAYAADADAADLVLRLMAQIGVEAYAKAREVS
jgi:hypothetical protein